MSYQQYWESLWKLVIIVFVLFFLLFLSVRIFIFLYDHIREFQIWNSPIWLKLKIPIIIICGVGFIVGWIRVSQYLEKKEMKLAMEYAQSQGWKFSKEDTDGLKPIVAEFLSDYTFNLHFIRTVESGQRSLILFNCSYKHKDAQPRQRDSHGTACLIRSNRFPLSIKPVDIEGRDWTEVMESGKVDMGTTAFAEKFLVISKDPPTARALVNTEIQHIMLQHMSKPLYNPVCVTLGSGGALVLASASYEHEVLDDLIDLAYKIEGAIR